MFRPGVAQCSQRQIQLFKLAFDELRQLREETAGWGRLGAQMADVAAKMNIFQTIALVLGAALPPLRHLCLPGLPAPGTGRWHHLRHLREPRQPVR
mgnify:CR=1 FL=1